MTVVSDATADDVARAYTTLETEFGLDLGAVPADALLVDVGVDSLAVLEIVIFVEERFPPFVVRSGQEPETAGDLAKLVHRAVMASTS